MSVDLFSLWMVVVGAARPDQELWRKATAFAPVLIEFSAYGAESTPVCSPRPALIFASSMPRCPIPARCP